MTSSVLEQPVDEQENKKELANRLYQAVGFETVGDIATDFITAPLLASPVPGSRPLYYGLNYGIGYGLNYLAQKWRGEEFKPGEAIAAGGFQTIPFGTTARGLKGITRAGVKGATGAITGEQVRVGIDEQRPLTFTEAVRAGTFGGALGTTLKGAGEGIALIKDLGTDLLNIIGEGGPGGAILSTSGQGLDPRNNLASILNKYKTFTGDKQAELSGYLRAGWDYRTSRSLQNLRAKNKRDPSYVPKRELMKGFSWNDDPRGVITDDFGTEWILTRQTGKGTTQWNLKTVASVENAILQAKSREVGWDQASIELKKLKKWLNANPDKAPLYYRQLMEYGNKAYLEHKVAQGMPWFWEQKANDPNFAPWASKNRNLGTNIRLLFNPAYKKLKDNVERQLKRLNQGNPTVQPKDQLIIDIRDPDSSIKGKNAIPLTKRNNPGNILIRRAGTGEVLGEVGDYLAILYDPDFARQFDIRKEKWIKLKLKDKYTANPLVRANDTYDSWRKRFIRDRINFIIREIPLLPKGKRGQPNRDTIIRSALREDLEWFYFTLFGDIGGQTPLDLKFVPQHVRDYLSLTPVQRKNKPFR